MLSEKLSEKFIKPKMDENVEYFDCHDEKNHDILEFITRFKSIEEINIEFGYNPVLNMRRSITSRAI